MPKKPKRKKPKVMTMERREMSAEEVHNMPTACAWEGCWRVVTTDEMMPPDWRNFLVYWSPYPEADKTLGEIVTTPGCYRDAVLCPEHAKALDGLLKDIGQALKGPPAGTA